MKSIKLHDENALRDGGVRNIFFSPHQDDVVLSCGGLLKKEEGDCLVATIFAGAYNGLTAWDRVCGFKEGDSPWIIRNLEDREALGMLGAEGVHFDARQRRYSSMSVFEYQLSMVKDNIMELVKRNEDCERIYVPLGVANADHEIVRDISLELFGPQGVFRQYQLVFYEDFPYVVVPKWFNSAHNHFQGNHLSLVRHYVDITDRVDDKVNAIMAYKSQVCRVMIAHFPRCARDILTDCRAVVSKVIRLYSSVALGAGGDNRSLCVERYWTL